MGIDEIEQRIRESGKEERSKVMKEVKEEIRKIMDEAEAEAKDAAEDAREHIEKEGELTCKRIIADAKLEKRKIIEDKRSEIVQNVFDGVRRRILDMGKKEKTRMLDGLIKEGKEEVQNPVVFIDKKYRDLVRAKASDIGDFGVIVESSDGSVRVDNTLNNIIERAKQNLKPKIVKIIFAEDASNRR